jgi:phosphate acetyltransferase
MNSNISKKFQEDLFSKAKNNKKNIVLPDSEEKRILEATSIILKNEIANPILLGNKQRLTDLATKFGLDISGATFVDYENEDLLNEKYINEYAKLREHKGITKDQAREKITNDISYFATMMVHFGDADGMVSGAVHTTLETIKPSFEIIKTDKLSSVVSGAFLMCLENEVLVYSDCAVNPQPTPGQLGEIAVTTALTAKKFGVDPKVAILSYSTGTSGKGTLIDNANLATTSAKEVAEKYYAGLPIVGPIQYDAATNLDIAKTKKVDNDPAVPSTVFIFPDLNAGNIAYKAVQGASGALAIGPILQGLNKPVNDLSRGATVDDIVNTVAVTAIQAQ